MAAVVVEGMSQVTAGRRFGLDRSSVGRFVRAWQAGASLEPRASSGRPRRLRLPEHVAALRESLASDPDLELVERGQRLLESEGLSLSASTLWRELRALGWTRKKDFRRLRAGSARARALALAANVAGAARRRAGLRGRERLESSVGSPLWLCAQGAALARAGAAQPG